MVQTFLLFDTITNEKTVKFMQRDIINSTITWHLGLVGSNILVSILPLVHLLWSCLGNINHFHRFDDSDDELNRSSNGIIESGALQ